MKALVAVLAQVLLVSGFSVANASVDTTILRTVELNGLPLDNNIAVVMLDKASQKIDVKILNDICGHYSELPEGHIRCMAMPIAKFEVSLPFTRTADGCGSEVYQAVQDQRPVDGALAKVTFTDNSKRFCENIILGKQVLEVSIQGLRGIPSRFLAYRSDVSSHPPVVSGDQAIYEALNVPEVDLNPGIAGSSRTQKSVGGLTCVRSLVIVPNAKPSYYCQLAH